MCQLYMSVLTHQVAQEVIRCMLFCRVCSFLHALTASPTRMTATLVSTMTAMTASRTDAITSDCVGLAQQGCSAQLVFKWSCSRAPSCLDKRKHNKPRKT
jgi:hypothetical protein